MPLQIKFFKNWNNKLNNDIFTTIRRHTNEKELYYLKNTNKRFNVMFNGKSHCEVQLIRVEVARFRNISHHFLMLDTGIHSPEELKDLFRRFGVEQNTDILILTFKRI